MKKEIIKETQARIIPLDFDTSRGLRAFKLSSLCSKS